MATALAALAGHADVKKRLFQPTTNKPLPNTIIASRRRRRGNLPTTAPSQLEIATLLNNQHERPANLAAILAEIAASRDR